MISDLLCDEHLLTMSSASPVIPTTLAIQSETTDQPRSPTFIYSGGNGIILPEAAKSSTISSVLGNLEVSIKNVLKISDAFNKQLNTIR